jgi:hypothetical protein
MFNTAHTQQRNIGSEWGHEYPRAYVQLWKDGRDDFEKLLAGEEAATMPQ